MANIESATNESIRDEGTVAIKIEPAVQEADASEDSSAANLEEGIANDSSVGRSHVHGGHLENDIANLLQAFNSNSAVEQGEPLYDIEHQKALEAVGHKREELAAAESSGDSTEAELTRLQIELTVLESNLRSIERLNRKEQEYQKQQFDENEIFLPEEDASDEDIQISPAPTREEALNLASSRQPADSDNNEDEETEPVRNNKRAARETAKPAAKKQKMAAELARSSNPKRRQTATKTRQGGRQGPNMINIGSLIRNDIVADAGANQNAGNLPSFEGLSTRRDARAALIASIPGEQRNLMRGQTSAIERAAKQFGWKGRGSMQVKSDGWRLKGMRTSLKSFQLLGAAWGCEREAGSRPPFGGILADTMGYGKTIQMITIMVENQPKLTKKNRTTLIVLPASIVDQWGEELARHLDDGIMDKIIIHKAGSRVQGPDVVSILKSFQIVITTYHEVMSNYPRCNPPLHLATDKAKDEWWEWYYNANKGPLLSMPFFRVILDEAHIIKNHESQTSKACRLLTAKYKWVISGTPLSNCMEELFSYFNFLGVDGAATYAQFKDNYAKRNDTTMQRLDAILRMVMIRRTGADRLMGKPLITLPALDHQTIQVDFNPVERGIYQIVRQRFINRINDWSASGKISQLSRNIFVMLLRLRQMCAHVLMISFVLRDVLESEDVEKLWTTMERNAQASNDMGKRTATVLKTILEAARDERESSGANTNQVPNPEIQPRTIDLTINESNTDFRAFFKRLLQDGTWNRIRYRSRCHACNEIPEGTVKISVPCGHFYCDECLRSLIDVADSVNASATCCECQMLIESAADMSVLEQIAEGGGDRPRTFPSAPRKLKGKERKAAEMAWLTVPGVELMSTKVQAVVATLEKWIKGDPNAKIVVFTLFIPMIKLLAKVCARKGWGFQEYTGAINIKTRNEALDKWKDQDENDKILLMSMRAGGLGLNLIEASYVVIVDPWWNEPAEDQAFSRIYRIGQKRDCVIRRFVIKDAIDTQLMLHLQKLKAEECDRVIDGRNQAQLDIHDLMKLFGPARRDPETNEVIITEDGIDGIDEFVISDEQVVIDTSDTEEVSRAPARPRDE